MHSLTLLVLAAVVLGVFYKVFKAWQRRHLPFPPGPPPRACIGNFLDLPTKLPWLTYTEWGNQYGDLVHVSAPGQHIVVVNSVKTAVELFEKRSHIYSDRPVFTMAKLMGWDFNFGLLPRGDKWRTRRRMFHQYFHQNVVRTYRPIQMKKIHQLLQGLLSNPEEFREHIKTRVISHLTLLNADKNPVQPTNDHFVALSESAVKKLSDAFFPGAVAVDTFPILRYLPSWMPGAGFQRFAAEARQLTKEMQEVPVNFVKQNMQKLFAANRYDEVAIQAVAGVAYAGGADTTVSSLASFCLAMALYPEIQKKAQTEIDTVIGTDRLPEFKDRPSLPYAEALYREVMRWKPVGPLGGAHASTEDDIYNGYFIPKGTTVIGNIWAMTRDESIYHEPNRFNPDRFFTADGKLEEDETILAFGFGRRICPGRHHADATIWATIVSVLSTFNIAKAKDATGKEIDIDPKYSDGMISHPEAFACSITPRSEMARTLVQATAETHDL
ncbi:O-methylsterigmatocystin oxidoreductase [Mycena sanguinolenta]|uniref:O-methylsterigmatocystin oxidoreductase n=1 Tax=Mycena sanguinolenta TaxID=230812 RepID=A0A8H6YFE6_9AGAR|nr:O-methylsterigmatocystin oxidoreductase [Mycena sanguinolenta]